MSPWIAPPFVIEAFSGSGFDAAYKDQMELYLRWMDKYKRRPDKKSSIGLISCGEENKEQVELLQLDRGEIRVAGYLLELLPKEMLGLGCTRLYGWQEGRRKQGGRWYRALSFEIGERVRVLRCVMFRNILNLAEVFWAIGLIKGFSLAISASWWRMVCCKRKPENVLFMMAFVLGPFHLAYLVVFHPTQKCIKIKLYLHKYC